MPNSDFIPESDEDFLAWLDNFIANLTQMPELGVSEAELKALKASRDEFFASMVFADQAEASAKQAMLELQRTFELYKTDGSETWH